MSFLNAVQFISLLTLDAGIDGGLLWLMVDDFNEFSAVVSNPVERLHLKRYVKNYVEQQEALESDQSQVPDDMVISLYFNNYGHFTCHAILFYRVQKCTV